MKAAMECCMQLHQWDQALQLAQQCNFSEAEGLLQQYAQHLLEKRKYMEAVELYRKVHICLLPRTAPSTGTLSTADGWLG
jgi:WD repeat-containing protein 35